MAHQAPDTGNYSFSSQSAADAFTAAIQSGVGIDEALAANNGTFVPGATPTTGGSAGSGGSAGISTAGGEAPTRRERDVFNAAQAMGFSTEEANQFVALSAGSDTQEIIGLMTVDKLYLDPAVELHEENIALNEQQLGLQLDMAETGKDIATAQQDQASFLFEQYRDIFAPAQAEVVRGAMAGIPVDTRLNHLTNDVRIAFDKQRTEMERQLTRFGLDPSDAAYQANLAALSQAQAATEVGVRNQARSEIEEESFDRQLKAVQLGSQLPAQATGAAGAASRALSTASNITGRGFGALSRAITGEANLFGSLARTALAGEQRESAARRIAEGQEAAAEGQAVQSLIETGAEAFSRRPSTPSPEDGGGAAPTPSGDNEFQEFEQGVEDEFANVGAEGPPGIFNEQTGRVEDEEGNPI